MDLINLVANCFLLLSNDYLLMIISLLLFVFSKEKDHSHLILLLLFSMIYKTILKDIFKCSTPLTSPSHNFGFPSGHMNFATMFYLWIMLTYQSKKLYLFGILSLILTGWSIVYSGFHNVLDIVLTPIFPVFFIAIYKTFLLKFEKIRILTIFMIAGLFCQLFSIYLIGYLKCDTIIGSYGILGFGLAQAIFMQKYKQTILSIGILISFFIISESSMQFIKNSLWTIVFAIPCFFKHKNHIKRN